MITLETDRIYSVSEAEDIINEAFKKGTCYRSKNLNYYNIICAFDIETSNFTDETEEDYKDIYLYNYLKGATIRVTDTAPIKHGSIVFSRRKGINIDEYYSELLTLFPGIFPPSYDPHEQMLNIIEVFEQNRPGNEDVNKHSIMYCWQFAIDGRVIFGRTWAEFLELIKMLESRTDKHNRLLIYVHNLAFEFQFIRTLIEWKKVFSIAPRKPIYAVSANGLEFRCSYILTNYSLAKLSEQLRHYDIKKLTGELDYKLVRHPNTPLTWNEIQYCINDVLVVSAYIQECILTERRISNIPLTATGYCRRYCRKMCLYGTSKKDRNKKFNEYNKLMQSMVIQSPEEYYQMKRAFSGGFTHASARYSGKILHDVDSIDFTSSYPFAALSSGGFPMSSGKEVKPKSKDEFEQYLKYYWCMFDCEFIGLTPKYINENYISSSHCWIKEKCVTNNGRVVSADRLATTLTHIDFAIIRRTYAWQHLKITNMRIYERGYLPKSLILAIIKLYQDKTKLKGVPGKEQEYLNGKALLNSVYGMMVTDISKDEIIYNSTWETKPADILHDLEKYNKSPKRFLFYPWGIHIVKVATFNLWLGILNFGDDYIYSDTDSIKCLNMEKHMDFINAYNRQCETKLRYMCHKMDIDYSELEPLTIKGEKKPLGVYDHDGHYDTFKTLGAKRYMVKEGDKVNITVSGVNKRVAVPYLLEQYGEGIFDAFNSGLEIPAGKTGKLTHVYIDTYQSGKIIDYLGHEYTYKEHPPGVYLEEAAYYFDIGMDYINYLKGVQYTK